MSEQSVDVTQILDQHIYRELFDPRIIILADALEQHNANRLCTSLLLLSFRDPTADIVFLINSPGGSVPGMLAIRDCMNGIPNDVITVNLGMAYSAGQFLLSAGTQGKRFCLPHAKVLVHQGSGGIGGVAQDIEIQANVIRHTRDAVLECISEDTGRSLAEVTHDSLRDRWFTAEQALEYGFVDHITADVSQFLQRPTRGMGLSAKGHAHS